jgi:hypothetical protein
MLSQSTRVEQQWKRCSKAVEISPLAVSHDYIDMYISDKQVECSEEAVTNYDR